MNISQLVPATSEHHLVETSKAREAATGYTLGQERNALGLSIDMVKGSLVVSHIQAYANGLTPAPASSCRLPVSFFLLSTSVTWHTKQPPKKYSTLYSGKTPGA